MEDCNHTPKQTGKVPYDPGWNDPPKFSYNTQQTTSGRPRNFLNKRVAFPLGSSGVNPATQPSPVNLPPMQPTVMAIPSVATPPRIEPDGPNLNIDSESTLSEVKNILLAFLENSSELGPKANDIKRRIQVMEDMWSSGKLNKTIHFQMKELACALRDDQPQKADDIHRALMVDHVSIVGTWMPGVKQLVHHCIARSELLALDKE